jgi:hypothetical protein
MLAIFQVGASRLRFFFIVSLVILCTWAIMLVLGSDSCGRSPAPFAVQKPDRATMWSFLSHPPYGQPFPFRPRVRFGAGSAGRRVGPAGRGTRFPPFTGTVSARYSAVTPRARASRHPGRKPGSRRSVSQFRSEGSGTSAASATWPCVSPAAARKRWSRCPSVSSVCMP